MRTRVAVLVVMLLLAWERRAEAALILIESLDSLAFGSSAIVYATRLSSVPNGEYSVRSTYRVDKSYFGDLARGQTFDVDDSFFPASDPMGDRDAGADEGHRVFFLQHPPNEPKTWFIAGTGARLVSDGRVQRYHQFMNPGGLAPMPEAWGRDRGPITFEKFEEKLAVAIARAERGHRILAAKDVAGFRNACLAMYGDPVLPVDIESDGVEAIAEEMLRALAQQGDVEGVVELVARSGTRFPFVHVKDATTRLVAMANDPQLPIPVRIAALESIDEVNWPDREHIRPDLERLAPLLDEPSPDFRIGVIHAVAAQARRSDYPAGPPERARAILRAHMKKETDPWARIALATARENDSVEPLVPHDPILAARQNRYRELVLAYFATVRSGESSIGAPESRYVAVDANGKRFEGRLSANHFGYGMASGDGTFDVPLPIGVYALTITSTFRFGTEVATRVAKVDRFVVDVAVVAPASGSKGEGGAGSAVVEHALPELAGLLALLISIGAVVVFVVRRRS